MLHDFDLIELQADELCTFVGKKHRTVWLFATDGFDYYLGAVEGLFGSACVYGQVLKTRRNNRVIRVERRVKIGTATRLRSTLWESEDSETLNTSFVERLNLTIRHASALALSRPRRRPAPSPR